jgi:hypothetical protein
MIYLIYLCVLGNRRLEQLNIIESLLIYFIYHLIRTQGTTNVYKHIACAHSIQLL